jgi:hypothetical protein
LPETEFLERVGAGKSGQVLPDVRERAVRMVSEQGCPVGPREKRPFGRPFYTPYWTTFELPSIDTNAASVGILDQIAAGLR